MTIISVSQHRETPRHVIWTKTNGEWFESEPMTLKQASDKAIELDNLGQKYRLEQELTVTDADTLE